MSQSCVCHHGIIRTQHYSDRVKSSGNNAKDSCLLKLTAAYASDTYSKKSLEGEQYIWLTPLEPIQGAAPIEGVPHSYCNYSCGTCEASLGTALAPRALSEC